MAVFAHFKRAIHLLLPAAMGLSTPVAAQRAWDPVTDDPPEVDTLYPARMVAIALPSGESRMNSVLYLAEGSGPHPTVVLLHGFPGHERNYDLAQVIRRAGWNVLAFTYRGAWGSEGVFSYANTLDDANAALTWLRSEAVTTYPISPDRIALVGHSYGGFVALMTAARDSGVIGAVSIAGTNMGGGASAFADPLVFDSVATSLQGSLRVLRTAGARSLVQERLEHASEWDLLNHAAALSKKPLLLIGGLRDRAVPVEENHNPLIAEISRYNPPALSSVLLNADHLFSSKRITLGRAIVEWLANLPSAAGG